MAKKSGFNRFWKFTIWLLFGLNIFLYAQQTDLKFRHIGRKEGLSQGSVQTIIQDKKGFVWMATEDGLNRYDGYKFDVFKHNPDDSFSLASNDLWTLFEDERGYIWIGTYQHGLDRFDPSREVFTHYVSISSDSTTISSNTVRALATDKNGDLWIGTRDGGLNKLDLKKNKIQRISTKIIDAKIRTIFIDSLDNLWLGTHKGLIFYNPKSNTVRLFQHDSGNPNSLSHNNIRSICQGNGDTLWIATQKGLNQFSLLSGKVIRYFRSSGLSSDDLRSVIQDKNGNIWVATTRDGLNILKMNNRRFYSYHNTPGNAFSLGIETLISLYEDNGGNVWVGTRGHGISIFSPEINRFISFHTDNLDKNQLSHPVIFAIAEQPGKYLWFGGQENGISQYSIETGQFTYLNTDGKDNRKIISGNIRCLYFDTNQELWIGYISAGIERFSIKSGFHRSYSFDPQNKGSISGDKIRTFYEDHNGNFWIGTSGMGLNLYQRENDSFIRFRHDAKDSLSICSDYINSILQDRNGMYWIATRDGVSVFRFEKELIEQTLKFKTIKNIKGNKQSLSNDYVIAITETKNGDLWLGTMMGLNHLSYSRRDAPVFTRYFQKDGLPSDVVYGILEDDKGFLWLSTNKGISKFDPQTGEFNNYTTEDGLINLEYNSGAVLKTRNGNFLFGGVNGVDMFNPDNMHPNLFDPQLQITSFRVNQKPYALEKAISYTDSIELSYKENYISFEYSALDYSNPSKIQYRYMLEGLDKDWVESKRNFANYTDLGPGEYTFIVKGTNCDGQWSARTASAQITITPPFWATWWFRLLLFIFVIGVIYSLHRFQVNNLLKLEKLRLKIASDLHDDIGANLTQIALKTDLMVQGIVPEDKKSYLTSISRMSRDVVQSLSDLVWSIDSRNDTLEKLIARMQHIALDAFSSNDIDCLFNSNGINSGISIDVEIRQNLFLVFKEAINNVLKHSGAKNVEINIVNNTSRFRMEIKDDGHGFSQVNNKTGNGLRNMSMRARQIKAQLEVVNNSAGVSVILERAKF